MKSLKKSQDLREDNMNIPFIDLKEQYSLIHKQVRKAVDKVLEHGAYVMGPEISQLENRLAELCGQKHALGCSSGTDALILALLALDIKPGDAVLTSPFTFFATAEAIAFLGAVPVFVDIDPATFNINPAELSRALKALTQPEISNFPLPRPGAISGLGHATPDRTSAKAVISVDLFGLPCEYDQISKLAEQEKLKLIVDAAQSFGARYKGKSTCALGNAACTSFFPAKPLGCYGDGGMCFTDDDDIIELLKSFRVHGQGKDRYDNTRLGMNARMDTIQAAILLVKMDIFTQELTMREKVAARYNTLFAQSRNDVITPAVFEHATSAWAQYSILARDQEHREKIFRRLKSRNIPWAVYYPLPLHLQQAFSYLGYKHGDFPVSEEISKRIFSLPMHPYITQEDQQTIVNAVLSA